MKKIFYLFFLISTIVYSQNRYSQTTTSSYTPMTLTDMSPRYQTSNYSQKISCQSLYDFIIENGYKKSSVSNYIMESSWLHKVTAYEYDYKLYVIAEIKESEYSYKTNLYIFCGIPNMNWYNFQYGSYGDSNSYGERFHKYIFDYKCNCE